MRLSKFVVVGSLFIGGAASSGCGGESPPPTNQGSQATPEMEKMRDDMMKNMQAQMKGKIPTAPAKKN